MDVTQAIENKILKLGGYSSSNVNNYSATKSLNFAQGININTAPEEVITAIPFTFKYEDKIGLFGAENKFVKIKLDIQGEGSIFSNLDIQVNNFTPVWVSREFGTLNGYETANIDFSEDTSDPSGDYSTAGTKDGLSDILNLYIRIDLRNLKTGNKYLDNWFDVRIYTKNKEEYDDETLYIKPSDYFYLGFHARNTKRLPYNVEVDIGREYLGFYNMTDTQRRLTPA